jgi:hypothetical protein
LSCTEAVFGRRSVRVLVAASDEAAAGRLLAADDDAAGPAGG